MSNNYIELPDEYSLEFPSLKLVFNVSPFPSFECIQSVTSANEIPPDDGSVFWVKIASNLFCCYEKKNFTSKCPLCGRPLSEEENGHES